MKRSIQYVLAGIVMTTAVAMTASAQMPSDPDYVPPNPVYDGRYAFARLRYTTAPGDACTCHVGNSNGTAGWEHDYPEGDWNIMHIATDMTTLNALNDSSVVVKADDPRLMLYPILYLSEPACWHQSETEVKALRKYLLKGGFLIVDDFSICEGGAVRFATSRKVFEEQIHRVLPEGKLVPIELTDPAVNTFFKLNPETFSAEMQRETNESPELYGIYEHNDPKRRLLVIANYNMVIHRFWVWEAQGQTSVAGGNEAYKIGVNYLLYGFTH